MAVKNDKSTQVKKASARPAASRTASRAPKEAAPKTPVRSPRSSSAKEARPQRRPRVSAARADYQGMSLDRKLDIFGIVLTFVGLLTLLSLLSPINGSLIGQWVGFLSRSLGFGMFLFPVALLITGLWLVLRNFEFMPRIGWERALGFLLLYLNLLAWFHLFVYAQTGFDPVQLAQEGRGGGMLGNFFFSLLNNALGLGGAGIALVAWFLIALSLSLDLTIWEMLRWLAPLAALLREGFRQMWSEFSTRTTAATSGRTVYEDPYSDGGTLAGYTPLPGGRTTDPRATQAMRPLPPANGQAVAQTLAGQPLAVPPQAGAGLHSNTPASQTIPEERPWVLPPVPQILDSGKEVSHNDDLDLKRAHIIEETLSSFSAPAKVIEINRGPTITQFGVEPDFIESRGGRMRVRVGKIAALADDLALALSARTIRIQAPVPGKGFVGIEVPNDETAMVALRDVLESEAMRRIKSPLRFTLGQNVAGQPVAADLASMPHLLIAGATGSGKSVMVNSIITCFLMNNTPDDLRLIMVDPKRVELTGYNGIPHLLAPVVVDLEKVVSALQWVTREMDMRYRKMAEIGSRNIVDFNAKMLSSGQKKLPYLVVIIDELADLMMLAPDETEKAITRLAQLARATGIHLILATQRPSVDVVTGLIKANFPARIAFAVASNVDSRTILDQPGAERLLGRGDMLFQAPDAPAPVRLQGVYVSDTEIQRLVTYWQGFSGLAETTPTAAGGIIGDVPAGVPLKQMPMFDIEKPQEDLDPLFNEAVDLSRRQGRASISMLQRRLRIGYTRAARLVETMEEKGIVGSPEPGTGTREILDYGQAAPPVDGEQ